MHQLGFPMTDPDVALVLRPEWAEKILSGSKTMELRGTSTTKRCNVAIAVTLLEVLIHTCAHTPSLVKINHNQVQTPDLGQGMLVFAVNFRQSHRCIWSTCCSCFAYIHI